jgi:hypothetical protein
MFDIVGKYLKSCRSFFRNHNFINSKVTGNALTSLTTDTTDIKRIELPGSFFENTPNIKDITGCFENNSTPADAAGAFVIKFNPNGFANTQIENVSQAFRNAGVFYATDNDSDYYGIPYNFFKTSGSAQSIINMSSCFENLKTLCCNGVHYENKHIDSLLEGELDTDYYNNVFIEINNTYLENDSTNISESNEVLYYKIPENQTAWTWDKFAWDGIYRPEFDINLYVGETEIELPLLTTSEK